jgi:hypothetical protein
VGDSAGLLAFPSPTGGTDAVELIPEHSPVRVDEWSARLSKTDVQVVYDHPDMFDVSASFQSDVTLVPKKT